MAQNKKEEASKTNKDTVAEKTTPEASAVAPKETEVAYRYTEAEDKFNTRLGEHQVKVSQKVDKTNDKEPVIRQTVSHEFQGKKQNTTTTATTIDTYNSSLGHTTKIKEDTHISTYRDKNKQNIKMEVKTTINNSDYAQDGALNMVLGKTTPYSYKNEKTETTTYNRDGSVATEASHAKRIDQSSSVKDSYKEYTDYEKGEIKRSFRAEATFAKLAVETYNSKKNTNFYSSLDKNGDEYYVKNNNKKGITIRVKDGKMSGVAHSFDKDGLHVTGKKELSQKQIKRELKSMRKEADKAVAKVSSAKTAQEYLAAIPPASQIARVGLSDSATFLDLQTDALVHDNKSQVSLKHKQEFDAKSSVDAEQILQHKIAEIKHR